MQTIESKLKFDQKKYFLPSNMYHYKWWWLAEQRCVTTLCSLPLPTADRSFGNCICNHLTHEYTTINRQDRIGHTSTLFASLLFPVTHSTLRLCLLGRLLLLRPSSASTGTIPPRRTAIDIFLYLLKCHRSNIIDIDFDFILGCIFH